MTSIAITIRRIRKNLATGLLFCALSSLGCQSNEQNVVDVQGRVTYQGQPASTGTISFSPKSAAIGATQRPATAVLDANGTYRLKAFRSRFGMPPGEYTVSILSYKGSMLDPSSLKYLIPKKFSELGTSGLLATVPEGHSGTLELNFDLK
jgi:hypothetical protein